MKRFLILLFVLGFSIKTQAATGNADDGFTFILIIAGLLIILVSILSIIEYLKNNFAQILEKINLWKTLLFSHFHKNHSH